MINKQLKEDWLALLKLNKKINTSENPEDIKEIIKIPFTPIQIDIHLLYYLSQFLYPKFINDQKNVVDIIISDYDIDNIAFEAFLYNTSRLGIYDSIKSIPKGVVSFKQKDLANLEQLFIKIQSTLQETNNIRIASVRFFRRKSIDLINRFYEKLEKNSTLEFLSHFLELIQKMVKEELLIIYPEPNIIIFLKSIISIIGNIKLSEIFEKVFYILPFFNQSIIFHSNKLNFILNLQKKSTEANPNLELTIRKLDLNQNPLLSNIDSKELSNLKKQVKNQNLLILNFESFIDYILEVSEFQMPASKEKLKLLLQKFFYAFAKIGRFWNIYPKPKVYSTLLRFILRLFSFNLNLRNLSYWALPDLLYYLIDTYFGLNFKFALLLTDTEEPINLISLTFHNGTPLNLTPLNKDTLIKTKQIKSLIPIWNSINNQYGFHALILKIDIKLLQNILDTFLFKQNKLGFFSFLSIIKLGKKSQFFDIYPQIPPFQLFKKKNSLILLKMLLDNIVDRYEF